METVIIVAVVTLLIVVFGVGWHFIRGSKITDEYKGYLEELCQSLGGRLLPRNPQGYSFELDHQGRVFRISYSRGALNNLKKARKVGLRGHFHALTVRTEVPDYTHPSRIGFRFDSGLNRWLGRSAGSGDPRFDSQVYVVRALPNPEPIIRKLVGNATVRRALIELSESNVDSVGLGRERLRSGLKNLTNLKPMLSVRTEMPGQEGFDPDYVKRLVNLAASIAEQTLYLSPEPEQILGFGVGDVARSHSSDQ